MLLTTASQKHRRWLGWLLIILLTAVCLRLFSLTTIPPGLTHDEADHGLTALSILAGNRDIYFAIGHGREPLYDYLTALLMAGIGPTFLAGRLAAVFAGLFLICGMAVWVRQAVNRQTALLTAAGLAVSFWPLMAARQSLRSIILPALFVFVVYFFWQGLSESHNGPRNRQAAWLSFFLAGLLLGLTFYTYIPSRALWLIFPLAWGYGWLTAPATARRLSLGLLLMLGTAAAVGFPLFRFLRANPDIEFRIRELSDPLTAVTQGNLTPLLHNISSGLGIITFQGDTFWRYNLPGRPLLNVVMGLLFAGGLLVAGWWVVRPWFRKDSDHRLPGMAAFLALSWLALGLAPVLVTGAELSTTQAMGMQPVLYLFPALMLTWLGERTWGGQKIKQRRGAGGLVLLLFIGTLLLTVKDYFISWSQAPAVRVQYESAMTAVLDYLNDADQGQVAVSTITPGPFHTPALAAVRLHQETTGPRWFDGRTSLLVPAADDSLIILSGFADLPPALQPYLPAAARIETIPQPATDEDQPLTVYQLNAAEWLSRQSRLDNPAVFGETAVLLGYDVRQTAVRPGEVVEVITLWQVGAATPEVRLFTHLSAADGVPFSQADGFSAPSQSWVAGDYLLQLHTLPVPPETAAGNYALTTGLYRCLDTACRQSERLPLLKDGQNSGDHLYLQDIIVNE